MLLQWHKEADKEAAVCFLWAVDTVRMLRSPLLPENKLQNSFC